VPKPPTEGDTEVVPLPQNDRRQRRRFSPEKKASILEEADKCTERGQLAELLRREGIYSAQLQSWRAQRDREGLAGLQPKRPGPKGPSAEQRTIEQQRKRIEKLEKELRIAQKVVELQKKAHEILGLALPGTEEVDELDSLSSSESATKRSR